MATSYYLCDILQLEKIAGSRRILRYAPNKDLKKEYSARTNMPDWYEKDRESLARYTQTQSWGDGILINEEEVRQHGKDSIK